MKRAAIYARVSSAGDRQNTGRQVDDLRQWATSMGLDVTEVFEEHVSGAKGNGERPVLQQCLDYCFKEKIDALLISELSRLGRNVYEVLENVKLCRDRGLDIKFQKEGLSLLNCDGEPNPYLPVILSVLATCAQIEREGIQFRLQSGRARYVAAGGVLGRKKGSAMTAAQIEAKYRGVAKELRRGTSLRRTARLCGVSVSTVQRVKKALGL